MTKGSGLAFVAERLGFPPATTVAFGDGENDVELLEWAGSAVAVANAHPRVLAVADWVCPSVDEEGVAQDDRSASRLTRMIDVRAARTDPDAYRAALARKGAAEEFDALMEADARLARARPAGRTSCARGRSSRESRRPSSSRS